MAVAAKRWMDFVALLRPSAEMDIDGLREGLDDQIADRRISEMDNPKGRAHAEKQLFSKRVMRARKRIAEAKAQRAEIRKTLLLEDDPDGNP